MKQACSVSWSTCVVVNGTRQPPDTMYSLCSFPRQVAFALLWSPDSQTPAALVAVADPLLVTAAVWHTSSVSSGEFHSRSLAAALFDDKHILDSTKTRRAM